MIRGLYTATTAMLANSRRMDVITNNLTSVETVGFKADTMTTRSFSDMLISRIYDPSVYQYSQVGPLNLGIHVDQVFTDFDIGSADETRRSTDFLIAGEGFFVVNWFPKGLTEEQEDETEVEERYTRAGNFALDGDGFLVTPDGYHVQGEDGEPILIGTVDFIVERDGTILVGDEIIGRLRTVRFEDNSVLRKQGDMLFNIFGRWEDGFFEPAGEPEDFITDIWQGFLETSNVDIARETIRMMETHRAYEVNQRVINMFDESLRISVNDIAKF
ncbi:MAG: flagellar hook-basal body protein [Oscillospiraceae bacterium]|nr:flagellar hook-basal body protein [Oscillospiraceae bacterium]